MENIIKFGILAASGVFFGLAIKHDRETKEMRKEVAKINERTYRMYPYLL